ncbi:uncharacterized protein LOC109850301 [Asparagus officinalis]|uniref:uncharacterized protein LOC109850301 n=1 Tax=Asparagus officinalis TaxID=4686 RepID=UPI00098DF405|nr:uncharacterized protein LOC109850301 [Asparagus officinalis]
MKNDQYSSWAELFKTTTRAYQVIEHIIPPITAADSSDFDADDGNNVADKTTDTTVAKTTETSADDASTWQRLDAVVLQWIYDTISNDLLHTIIEPDSTAQQAWDCLDDIFQDNKNSRAVYLENQFTNTRLENFSNVSAYCRALKVLSDQLANVGVPVTNHRLVLRLVNKLPAQYDTVAFLIQQTEHLPPFYKARSMVTLEETRKAHQAGSSSAAALVSLANPPPRATDHSAVHAASQAANPPHNQHYGSQHSRGRGGRGRNNENRSRNHNGDGRGGNHHPPTQI